MNLQEKYHELQKLLRKQELELPPAQPKPKLEEDRFMFIVIDDTSTPSTDFNCYAKLESDS